MLFEGIHQVFCILLSLMAGSMIINNKGERNGSGFVEEQSWGMLGWETAMLCKIVFELVVCQFA